MTTEINLLNGTLKDCGAEIVAQGWLDIEGMSALLVDDYQREELTSSKKKGGLKKSVEKGRILPPITLGMRGQRYHMNGKNMMVLEDPVYIVDGLQRVFALKTVAAEDAEKAPKLLISAEVRFSTTKAAEKELFEEMNLNRTSVSPNVILRNRRDRHSGVLTLYGLSHSDRSSPLYGRVSWTQRMNRGELVTALMVAKVASKLHGHKVTPAQHVRYLPDSLDKVGEEFGLKNFRDNMQTFFSVVHECWSLAHIEYTQKATHLRGNFLEAMAMILSAHTDFWEGNKLVVRNAQRKRIAAWPVLDPEVGRLASAGNMALSLLCHLLVEHYNKGLKTNRLQPREPLRRSRGNQYTRQLADSE